MNAKLPPTDAQLLKKRLRLVVKKIGNRKQIHVGQVFDLMHQAIMETPQPIKITWRK